MKAQPRLSFGILLGRKALQQWQADCVVYLLSDSRISLDLLIIDDRPEPAIEKKPLSKRLNKLALFKAYRRFFAKVPATSIVYPDWLHKTPLLNCEVAEKNHVHYFHPDDIERIASHRLDFILRFGFNILRGDILNVAQFGIWSFHHGDEQHYRGGPPAFWEILHKKPVVGAILQRLTPKLDSGIILKKGYLKTTLHSWPETHNNLLVDTAKWPLQVARDFLNEAVSLEKLLPADTEAPIYRFPRNAVMLRFMWQSFFQTIRFHFKELFRPEQWNVGVVEQPIASVLESDLKTVKWFPKQGANAFSADPFGFEDGGEAYVLYELYDQRTQCGQIHARDSQGNKHAIFPETDHHLSYPFIFKYHDEVYCMPESHESNSLELYRWNRSKKMFEPYKILLGDLGVIDATMAHIGETFWIFCTHKERSNSALYLYHSDSPFGPFKPHLNNPVKWDVRSSRPGGHVFKFRDNYYRPAQDCSTSYGAAIVIHRIVEISPSRFKEVEEKRINPIKPYRQGLHTLSAWGNKTLIDGKIYRFSPQHFTYQLGRKMGRVLQKLK